MRYLKALLFYAVLFFAQPMLAAVIPVFQLPNLILCVTVMHILLCKEDEECAPAIIMAAVFSLMHDICCGQYMGVGMLSLLAAVLASFVLKRLINNENRLMVILTICAVSATYNLTYWIISFMLGSPYGFLYMLKHVLIYLVADLVVCLCIYFASIGKIIQDRRDRYFR